ncbi:hypothetical protein BJ875DRAFT_438444 [Amylocarpus encephaloides]|uniref:Uncharacterized protein n=1 Tax=Amylocarpus encephaloides TaxID=45428 RepID=A0A9P7YPW2_9HELO|nr:hypothetical protein BJ875DRAFT_438444 [Amylocarpus encephaloides]
MSQLLQATSLQRRETHSTNAEHHHCLQIIRPYLAHPDAGSSHWRTFTIQRHPPIPGDDKIIRFAINPFEKAYITYDVDTRPISKSEPKLPKYRDIIADSYKHVCGDLDIKLIVTHGLANPSAILAVKRGFEAQGKSWRWAGEGEGERKEAYFVKGGKGWREFCDGNPFAVGTLRMLQERGGEGGEMEGKGVGRFVGLGTREEVGLPSLHVVAMIVDR